MTTGQVLQLNITNNPLSFFASPKDISLPETSFNFIAAFGIEEPIGNTPYEEAKRITGKNESNFFIKFILNGCAKKMPDKYFSADMNLFYLSGLVCLSWDFFSVARSSATTFKW